MRYLRQKRTTSHSKEALKGLAAIGAGGVIIGLASKGLIGFRAPKFPTSTGGDPLGTIITQIIVTSVAVAGPPVFGAVIMAGGMIYIRYQGISACTKYVLNSEDTQREINYYKSIASTLRGNIIFVFDRKKLSSNPNDRIKTVYAPSFMKRINRLADAARKAIHQRYYQSRYHLKLAKIIYTLAIVREIIQIERVKYICKN